MPRPRKPARLYLRSRTGRPARWVIRDGDTEIDTRCGEAEREEAERIFGNYLQVRQASADRPGPTGSGADLSLVLATYRAEHAVTVADPERIRYAVQALLPWWGHRPPEDVTRANCRRYSAERKAGNGTVRRELGVLQAALNHAGLPQKVTLPERPTPTERWLTRGEVAAMVRAARRLARGSHLARFILIAAYTGTRSHAILGLRWRPHADGGHVDTAKGILYRRSATARITGKRQTPAPIPAPLLRLMRAWERTDPNGWLVAYRGGPVASIKTAWKAALTGLPFTATPHTLRHTAITWAMQNGAPINEASGFFGVSRETLERVYWHHHPDFLKSTTRAMERQR